MIKSYKIRLLPSPEQEKTMWQSVNAARFVWNWGLAYQMELFSKGEKHLSGYDMRKVLVELKKTDKFSWLNNVSSKVSSMALLDLDEAYKRFFKTQKTSDKYTKQTIQKAKRLNKKLTPYDLNGHPKFKKKAKAKPSFYVTVDNFYIQNDNAVIEKIGKVKYQTAYELPKVNKKRENETKYTNPRISFINGKWLITFGMEVENQDLELNNFAIGIDLGVKDLAVVSANGEKIVFKNINKTKRVKKLKRRLKHAQREVSRKYDTNDKLERYDSKYHKSNNIIKAEAKTKQIANRLTNIRKNYIHQTTTKIIKMLPKAIVMEDLNVTGMMKNKHLSKAIQEQCFYEFIRQIEYKCKFYGIEFIQADRFFPSSKKCSCCGEIKRDLKLKDRTYKCEHCGFEIDRDFNAAINLEKLAN